MEHQSSENGTASERLKSIVGGHDVVVPFDGTYPHPDDEPKVADFTDKRRVGPNCSDNPMN